MSVIERIQWRCRREASRRLGRRMQPMRNKQPIISFTFDDFPVSALTVGGAILRRHGVAGTYFASLGLMGRMEPTGRIFEAPQLARAVAEGHELGCHTFAHCDAWATPPAAFERSVVDNRQALAQVLPNGAFPTLAYPINSPRPGSKRRCAKYFSCCRGGGQRCNAGETDANSLSAFFLEKSRDDFDAVARAIDDAVARRGWLIFATHDVDNIPTPYGVRPDFFERVVERALQSGAMILPMHAAWRAVAAPS